MDFLDVKHYVFRFHTAYFDESLINHAEKF
jgi:hypothetical protein